MYTFDAKTGNQGREENKIQAPFPHIELSHLSPTFKDPKEKLREDHWL